jgi:hypothetical protein
MRLNVLPYSALSACPPGLLFTAKLLKDVLSKQKTSLAFVCVAALAWNFGLWAGQSRQQRSLHNDFIPDVHTVHEQPHGTEQGSLILRRKAVSFLAIQVCFTFFFHAPLEQILLLPTVFI